MGDKQIRFENKQGAIRIFINDGIEQSIDVTREIADLLQAERSKTIEEIGEYLLEGFKNEQIQYAMKIKDLVAKLEEMKEK
jgi:ferritin